MNPIGFHVRLARPADRDAIAVFECPSADPAVEPFVRLRALERHLAGTTDFRLLIWHQDDGQLVGVAAHERNWRVQHAGATLPGTEIVVVAVAARFRDGTHSGRPLIAQIVDDLLDDVRGCNRGDLVAMFVHPDNIDGQRVVGYFDTERDGSADGYDVFARVGI